MPVLKTHKGFQLFLRLVYSALYTVLYRVSQYVSNVCPKVPKQANVHTSLQNAEAEIELCTNCSALRCSKTIQYRKLVQFLC